MIFTILWIFVRLLENTFERYWELYINLDFAIAALIGYALVIFALHYPKENKNLSPIKEIYILMPIAILAILSFFNVYYEIFSYRVIEYSYNYIIYILILIIYFLGIGGTLFIKKLIKSKGIERVQLKYISFGYISSISVLLFDSIYTAYEGARTENWDFIFFNFTIIFAIIITYAMLRYRFMDIRVIVRKSIVYGFSLIIVLGVFAYFVLTFKQTIEESWNLNTSWTAGILIIIVAVGFPSLKTFVEKVVNKIFQDEKSIDLAVAEVKEKLSHETDFDNLIHIIKKEIKEYLQVENIQLFVLDKVNHNFKGKDNEVGKSIPQKSDLIKYFEKYDDVLITEEIPHLQNERSGKFEIEMLKQADKEIKKYNFRLAMPVIADKEIIAVLGFSGIGKSFTVQDIDYLNKLREQIAFAIANALLYKEAIDRIKK